MLHAPTFHSTLHEREIKRAALQCIPAYAPAENQSALLHANLLQIDCMIASLELVPICKKAWQIRLDVVQTVCIDDTDQALEFSGI